MKRYWVGKARCCGAISAALVADEKTTNKDIASFAKGLGKFRVMEFLEIEDGNGLEMSRCKCSQINGSAE